MWFSTYAPSLVRMWPIFIGEINGVQGSWLAERWYGHCLCIDEVRVCGFCVRQTVWPSTFWVVLKLHCFTSQGTVSWPIQKVGGSWCQNELFMQGACQSSKDRVETSLHFWEQVVFVFMPACLLINVCISSKIDIRFAFIDTYHILGRLLVWECGLHPSPIPRRCLNALTETDSWAARSYLRFRRSCEVK